MRGIYCLLLATAAMAQSPDLPDAKRLLLRASGPMLLADTVRLEGKESIEIGTAGGPQKSESDFRVLRAPGGRLRVEGSIGQSKSLVVSDGVHTVTYLELAKTYSIAPANNGATGDAYGRLKFARDPAAITGVTIVRNESLEFNQKLIPCSVVRAAYTKMAANPFANDVVRTVWISQSDDLILQDSWEFSLSMNGEAPGKGHITTTFARIEWGMPLADSLFEFHAPDGSHQVTVAPPSVTTTQANLTPSLFLNTNVQTLFTTPPEYTAEARAAGLQGTVSLYTEIDSAGHPSKVEVMQGLGLGLDEKAIEAVKQYQYQPTASGSNQLQAALDVEVHFRLDQPALWQVAREVFWFMLPQGDRHVNELVKPVLSHYVAPDAAACAADGSAVIQFLVDTSGNPQQVSVVKEYGASFGGALAKAVRSWQFQAGLEDGKPVGAHAEVELQCGPGVPADRTPGPPSRVGRGVSPPVLTSKTEPEYSEEARKSKLQGMVLLKVIVGPDGRITNVAIMRMLGAGLDKKAMEAVKRWQFSPGMKDGNPVAIEANIEVNFRLL